MTLYRKLVVGALALSAVSIASACPFCQTRTTGLFIGESEIMGNGSVRAWVLIGKDEKPQAVGATLSETALEGLAMDLPEGEYMQELNIRLPKQAAPTMIDHNCINWAPKGHIPDPIYTVPHFDFHFYWATQQERSLMKIVDGDLSKFKAPVPDGLMPDSFINAPGGEEQYMGAHYVNPGSPEFNGKKFDKTFIYGAYESKVIFLEPMVTLEFLLSKPEFIADIPQPKEVAKPGYYPTKYAIRYDKVRKEYTVSLEGFVHRS
jgi:hypothetical protein